MTKGKRLEEYRPRKEKPKYFPVHPNLYPVIRAFHRNWFKDCRCQYCEAKK